MPWPSNGWHERGPQFDSRWSRSGSSTGSNRPVGSDARPFTQTELQVVDRTVGLHRTRRPRPRCSPSPITAMTAPVTDSMSTHKMTSRSRDRARHRHRPGHPRLEPGGPGPPAHAAVNAGRPGTSPTVTLPTPTLAPKIGCTASSHGRVRTAQLHPTARSRHCSRRGGRGEGSPAGSRSWPCCDANGFGRSITARRPAVN